MKLEELLQVMGSSVDVRLTGSSDRFNIYGAHLASGLAGSLEKHIDWHDWRGLKVEYVEILDKNKIEIHIDLYESGTEERLADDKFKTEPDNPEIVPEDKEVYHGIFEPDPTMAFRPLIGEKK